MTRRAYASGMAAMICAAAIYAVPGQQAFAHEFSGDESASFLALIESIKVELGLVQSNLGSNATLAEQHVEHAHGHLNEDIIEEISERNDRLGRELPAALEDLHDSVVNSTEQEVQPKIENINNLLDETIIVRIDSDQLSNSTVWALVIANMADGTLTHYTEAYSAGSEEGEEHSHDDEESGNATDDEMNMTEMSSTRHNDMEMEEGGNRTMGEGNATTIANMVHYQSAQGMAARTQQLFADQVKELIPANSTEFVTDLEASLEHLVQAIDNREPLADVEVIVHGEVHLNLQKVFNLQVIPEFPLPMLLIIPAIAGIIAATRFSALRRK